MNDQKMTLRESADHLVALMNDLKARAKEITREYGDQAEKLEEKMIVLGREMRRLHRDKNRVNTTLSRQKNYEMIEKLCEGQPAGTPAFIDKPGMDIVLSPHYTPGHKKMSHQMRRMMAEKHTCYIDAMRREAEETPAESDESEKDRKYAREVWREWRLLTGQIDRQSQRRVRRRFFSTYLGAHVVILEDTETKKVSCKIEPAEDHTTFKATLYLNTWEASQVYSVEAETKAMECLKSKITEEQFKRYFCTGMLVERSKRSRLIYIFRRCRPALVYRLKQTEFGMMQHQFVAGLCIHPQGYYMGSWAGTLVPTDDVISQLLMMRGDEVMLWRQATQHDRYSPQADV
jgi:hypothetical protein